GSCADSGVGPSEETYSFPGCAPSSLNCPNDGTLGCALRAVRSRHDSCLLTAECVEVPFVGGCTGWTACPPYSVNDAGLAGFLSEARAEVMKYCACPQCSWSLSCPGVDAGQPRCVSGHCTFVTEPVLYQCADPFSGQCFQTCPADEACFTQMACRQG